MNHCRMCKYNPSVDGVDIDAAEPGNYLIPVQHGAPHKGYICSNCWDAIYRVALTAAKAVADGEQFSVLVVPATNDNDDTGYIEGQEFNQEEPHGSQPQM